MIGQIDFDSADPSCAANRLFQPSSVAITPNGRLVVADAFNHRVLVWHQIPVPAAGALVEPDVVLGQGLRNNCVPNDDDFDGFEDIEFDGPVMTSIATARTLKRPQGVWADDRRLVVSDGENNRVLIWNYSDEDPLADFQPADLVLGHADFNNTRVNNGQDLPSANTLNAPNGIHSDGVGLAVADFGNGRVLVWKTFPQFSAQGADVVIGQPTFDQFFNGDTTPPATSSNTFSPVGVLLTPDELFVSDIGYHRVLVFRKH